jgi:hypothetical protein
MEAPTSTASSVEQLERDRSALTLIRHQLGVVWRELVTEEGDGLPG